MREPRLSSTPLTLQRNSTCEVKKQANKQLQETKYRHSTSLEATALDLIARRGSSPLARRNQTRFPNYVGNRLVLKTAPQLTRFTICRLTSRQNTTKTRWRFKQSRDVVSSNTVWTNSGKEYRLILSENIWRYHLFVSIAHPCVSQCGDDVTAVYVRLCSLK